MKIRGFRAESVFAVPTRIPDFDIEGAVWARGPRRRVYAKEHEQTRAGISGSGCQSSLKLMFPQWQLPWMSIEQASDGGSQRVTSKASAQRIPACNVLRSLQNLR